MTTFQGKTVVITGASEGLGRCLAEKIALLGAHVLLLAHEEKKLVATSEELKGKGAKVSHFVCDIRDDAQVVKTVAMIKQVVRSVDILINNAGVWTDNLLEQERPDLRSNAIQTNALGTINMTEAMLPMLTAQAHGHIFNVISVSGIGHSSASDSRFCKSYAASKWAVTGYTKFLRDSLVGTGLKVSSLFPGGFESNFYENAGRPNPHNQPWMMKTEDIADTVIFMLSRPGDMVVEEMVVTKFFGKEGS